MNLDCFAFDNSVTVISDRMMTMMKTGMDGVDTVAVSVIPLRNCSTTRDFDSVQQLCSTALRCASLLIKTHHGMGD